MAQRYKVEASLKKVDLKIILMILKSLISVVESVMAGKEAHGDMDLENLVSDGKKSKK